MFSIKGIHESNAVHADKTKPDPHTARIPPKPLEQTHFVVRYENDTHHGKKAIDDTELSEELSARPAPAGNVNKVSTAVRLL